MNLNTTAIEIKAMEGNLIEVANGTYPVAHLSFEYNGVLYVNPIMFHPVFGCDEDGFYQQTRTAMEVASDMIPKIVSRGFVCLEKWIPAESMFGL
ncbi:hypothetical protein VPHD479_0087 [Vibrio phage D479]